MYTVIWLERWQITWTGPWITLNASTRQKAVRSFCGVFFKQNDQDHDHGDVYKFSESLWHFDPTLVCVRMKIETALVLARRKKYDVFTTIFNFYEAFAPCARCFSVNNVTNVNRNVDHRSLHFVTMSHLDMRKLMF